MNRYGRMDVAARAKKAPVLAGLHGPALQLKGVKVLDARTEIEAEAGDLLIPPSLRPAIPSYGSIAVSQVADSEVGAFTLAELRVGVRIGAVASFFLVGAVVSTDEACAALAGRFGFPVQVGRVELDDTYHQVCAHVAVGGRTALKLRIGQRRPLPGTRLNLSSLVTLARRGPKGPSTLLHVPVQADWGAVDGGRQLIDAFAPEAFGAAQAFRPAFPMSAAFGTCELTLGAPDATIDPQQPAEESLAAV
jgi:hypothetical protein